MEVVETCVNVEVPVASNTIMAVCSDGKVRRATIRGKHAFVRVREMKRDYTITGWLTANETGEVRFTACPGGRNSVFLS